MANIIFYQKPGCINNTRQLKMLKDAGHLVEARDLLHEKWCRDSLLEYLDDLPTQDWFNSSAPDVKCGRVVPAEVTREQALELIVENPILLRRPLMRVGKECRVGFDIAAVDAWIGLDKPEDNSDLETCPRDSGHSCDSLTVEVSG